MTTKEKTADESINAPARKSSEQSPVRFGFVLDQQVGLRTQALNLESVVQQRTDIDPCWVPVRYQADAVPLVPLARLPLLPAGIRGTLRGVSEIRDGLKGRHLDAVLWSTWAAKSVPDLVGATPAVLVMDMTPQQMEAMGALYGYNRARARFGGRWKRRATDRLYTQAHHFYPWSQFVAGSLMDDYGVAPERITVTSPGVDVDRYCPDSQARADDGVVRILFVGGDLMRKGGDLLLRWFTEQVAYRKRSDPLLELHLVTRDTPPDPLPHGVHLHQGIANNSPQLIALYQSCDVFVLPTRADCYSLVALEAMASGLPVVISDLGGIRDIVGSAGTLIPPGDYDALTEALNRLVHNPLLRTAIGTAARHRMEDHFDCRHTMSVPLLGMYNAAGKQCPVTNCSVPAL